MGPYDKGASHKVSKSAKDRGSNASWKEKTASKLIHRWSPEQVEKCSFHYIKLEGVSETNLASLTKHLWFQETNLCQKFWLLAIWKEEWNTYRGNKSWSIIFDLNLKHNKKMLKKKAWTTMHRARGTNNVVAAEFKRVICEVV